MPAHRLSSPRRWVIGLLPALIAGLVTAGVLVGGAGTSVAVGVPESAPRQPGDALPAAALPAAAQLAAPTTVTKGKLTVTVDPAQDIGAASSAVTVAGSGFDPGKDDLWVAICQDGGGAPKDLTSCLGGPIPDENASTSWGIVTDQPKDAPPGPVVVKWADNGFSMTLQIAGGADQAADCLTGKCSVFVRNAGGSGGRQVTVPIAFKAPPISSSSPSSASVSSSSAPSSSSAASSSSPSSASPSAKSSSSTSPSPESSSSAAPSSTAPVPTTVPVQDLLMQRVQQGRDQVAVFAGFTPGEMVTVRISGNPPAELPDVTADDGGTVRVTWAVPKDFPVAGYSMRVEGQTSLRVGEANFSVVAAIVPSTSSASPTTSAPASSKSPVSSSRASSPVSSRRSTTRSPSRATSTAESSTASSQESTTATTVTGTPSAQKTSSTPWWLWITLAAVLLIGLVVAAVAMGRRHRESTEAEIAAREAELANGLDEQVLRQPPVPPPPPPVPNEYQEHPDRPILFSHRQAEHYSPPTEVISAADGPTEAIGTPPIVPAGDRPPPGPPVAPDVTGAWTPDFTAERPSEPGPGTQQFDPFADEPADPDGRTGPDTDANTDPDDKPNTGPNPDNSDDRGQWEPPGR